MDKVQRIRNKNLQQRRLDATPRGVGAVCDFYAQSAEDSTIADIEDNRYIDFAVEITVLNTGHRHPRPVQAAETQPQAFTYIAYQIVLYESYVPLAEKINVAAPTDGKYRAAFFITRTEAVENAVEIAHAHTGRPGIIVFSGGFRGRTYMTMTSIGKVAPYEKSLGPFPGSIRHTPYPPELQGISTVDSLKVIERLFKADIDSTQITTIVFEPTQGEEGFVVALLEFAAAIRRTCDEHGIMMIADEVQSGFARTGQLSAMDHYADKADLTTMVKSLAGDIPLSGVVGEVEIMDAPAPGGLGGIYAGSPSLIVAAHAVLDITRDKQPCQRVTTLGEQLRVALTGV